MSQLLPCSHCQRTFTLRDDVSNNALLRCPNCSSQIRVSELQDAIYAPWHVVHDPAHATSPSTLVPPTSDETVHDTIVDPTARLGLLGGLPVDDLSADHASAASPMADQAEQPASRDAQANVDSSELTVVEAFDETCVIDPATLDADFPMTERAAEGNLTSEDIFKTIPQGFQVSPNQSWNQPAIDSADAVDESIEDDTVGTVEEFDQLELSDDDQPVMSISDVADSEMIHSQVIDQPQNEVEYVDDEHLETDEVEELSINDVVSDSGVEDTLTPDEMQLNDITKEIDAEAMTEDDDREFDTQNEFQLETSEQVEDAEPLSLSGGEESAAPAKPPKRVRQSQRSGLGSLIQVVLGGAAAIPVTLLLLWYVVGIDVADAGPAVAKVAPWVVPQKFRGTQLAGGNRVTPPNSMNEMMELDNGTNSTPASTPAEAEATPQSPVVQPVANESNTSASTEAEQPAPVTEPVAEQPKTDATDATAAVTPMPATPVVAQPTSGESTLLANNSSSTAASNAPATASEVIAKVALAKKQINDWQANTQSGLEESKRKHIIELLNSLAAASNLAADLPEGSTWQRAIRNDLGEVGRKLVADEDLESWFRKVVYAQFNTLPRPNPGRVILMNLGEQSQDAGDAWQVSTSDSLLKQLLALPTLEIPKNLLSEVRPGQRVFMLGKIVNSDPSGAPKKSVFRASFVFEL